jgi:hypothetical protein
MKTRAFPLVLALCTSACFVRGGAGLFLFAAETAVVAAVIVSATEPPPPRVIFVPEPRPGYAWQPGYWTLQEGQWLWVDGGWVPLQPGYTWSPAHWEHAPDGTWRLLPGRWEPSGAPPPPPPPPPPPAQRPPAPSGDTQL